MINIDIIKIISDIISLVAMAFAILSYQQKKQRAIIFFQLIATSLFSISFFMIGAMTGCLLNVISVIRALLFMHKKQLKTDNIFWLIGFIAVYITTYILTFTVFGKEFNLLNAIIELFPVIGMTGSTFGFRAKTAKGSRIGGLINEPSWLVYNIVNLSPGAIGCNVFSTISIIIGFIRHDRKKVKKENNGMQE